MFGFYDERSLFNFIKEFILVILIFIFIVVISIGIAACGNYFVNKKQCNAICTELGYKYSYGFWQGCIIEKADGKKIRLEQLRDFNE